MPIHVLAWSAIAVVLASILHLSVAFTAPGVTVTVPVPLAMAVAVALAVIITLGLICRAILRELLLGRSPA
jgi:hypothetical protein